MGVLNDIARWLWKLIPANPILVRVVTSGGKRWRHFYARAAYLIVLFVVMLVQGGGLLNPAGSLAELAKQSTQTFMWVSVVQLLLMSFIAPVFTAGAITQEKDANTFHILLTTPLSSGQIVFGTLLSRIYFVWVMLLAGLPIFCITMIFGGVTATEVFQSLGLAAVTGLATGAIAILISMLRVGTTRTIIYFFVGVAVYLLGGMLAGASAWGQLAEAPLGTALNSRMSWLAPVHPFLSLLVVTGQTPAPNPADVRHYGWPASWFLAYPQYAYLLLMTLLSILMVVISIAFVRRGAREGESTFWSNLRAKLPLRAAEHRRRPRSVWRNPIAWREAVTRGSAGGRSAARWVFMAMSAALGLLLAMGYHNGWWGFGLGNSGATTLAREWLTGLIWIELAVILVVVTNTAATTLTREKESQTMELLLATPLTSKYIIAGMLQGLVRFVLPLIAVPTVTLFFFVVASVLPWARPLVVSPEALVLVPLLMVAFASLSAMVGLQFSLVSRRTIQAVMISTSIVLGGSLLLGACGIAVVSASPQIAAFLLPFSPFPAIAALIDPAWVFSGAAPTPGELLNVRLVRVVAALIASGAYLAVTFSLYLTMVRNFDMTVRKQST